MTKISYVNGRYIYNYKANISINDRTIHFADAAYEVVGVYDEKLLFWEDHYKRLKNSLKLLGFDDISLIKNLEYKCKEIIDKNFLVEGLIYIHVSRGIAKRDHNWSNKIKPTLIISAISKNISNEKPKKIALISNNDIRWKKCNIKSVSLLPNVLLKQKALKNNASECIMFNDKGYLTEATTSNVFVIKQKTVFTPNLKNNILPGVTRKLIFSICKHKGIKAVEKNLTMRDLLNSDGVFLSNTSSFIVEAKKINNNIIKTDKKNIINQIRKYYLEIIGL
tara:strand:- start:942 stop:1778 length:837 start_codon:yes stop_codon:yes gene_type:complete